LLAIVAPVVVLMMIYGDASSTLVEIGVYICFFGIAAPLLFLWGRDTYREFRGPRSQ
jgi:hypothetical protein